MSLKKIFFKSKITYKIYLIYNLYIRHKCFLKRAHYSQWGEDLIIADFFKEKTKGTYLDVGCFHPFMYSNTCLLFQKGWRGINIDINSTSIDLFNIVRPNDLNLCTTINENKKDFKAYFDHSLSPINTLSKEYFENFKNKFFKENFVKNIKSKSIDEILNLAKLKNIDFVNVDVEGMDFEIIKQMIPNKIQPLLISIETHNVNGSKSQDCDNINNFLNNYGYKTLKRVGPTTIFKY